MIKLFLDANVFLDVLFERLPSAEEGEALLNAAEQKELILYASSSILLTVMYFLKKDGKPSEVIAALMNDILSITRLVSPSETVFRQGLYAGFSDGEDGVQYYTALHAGNIDYFITNNTKHFKLAMPALPVLTPKQFLAL